MKHLEITYTKGHLIDVSSGKRIFLKRGGKFVLMGDDDQFELKDELEIETVPCSDKEKILELTSKYPKFHLEKIAVAGQKFIYRIGLSKRISEDKAREFWFEAQILEDLYIRSQDGIKWKFCDCICTTELCIAGELQMIEPVKGISLNNLYSNMVAFYFPLQRSGACNAFTNFYLSEDHNLYPGKGPLLDRLREQVISKYIQKDTDWNHLAL
jgi:hypothetical protein